MRPQTGNSKHTLGRLENIQKRTLQVDLKGRAFVDQAKSLGLERNDILNESTSWANQEERVCLLEEQEMVLFGWDFRWHICDQRGSCRIDRPECKGLCVQKRCLSRIMNWANVVSRIKTLWITDILWSSLYAMKQHRSLL